ncbi:hypothetical protein PAPYR_4736 [Paratrimastix pyriformis]|uniref:Uncharacterized protein n=1 Tax=Paratrimastix pyriformis TaxID=342808 RepID=A0ABQ8ULS2_9EUKA|nr:hypothetical protein PAPYR_4736 [Paratrimastix pyriformis]
MSLQTGYKFIEELVAECHAKAAKAAAFVKKNQALQSSFQETTEWMIGYMRGQLNAATQAAEELDRIEARFAERKRRYAARVAREEVPPPREEKQAEQAPKQAAEGEQAADAEGEQAADAEGEQAADAEGEQAADAGGEQAADAGGEQAADAGGEQAAEEEKHAERNRRRRSRAEKNE